MITRLPWRWRRWLITRLVGEESVAINISVIDGSLHMKSPFWASRIVVSYPPKDKDGVTISKDPTLYWPNWAPPNWGDRDRPWQAKT